MKFVQAKTRQVLTFLFVLLVSISGVSAQTNYGSVRGEVTDTQGATIGGAKVILSNQSTKVERVSVTNDKGIYQFGGVDPGTYKVTIAMPGFKTFDAASNAVTLGNIATVDATLTLGAASETVEVTADSVQLSTASASGGQVFSEQQLEDLPSLGRNPFLFVTLDSNVVTLGDPRYVRAEDQTGGSQVSVAGAPSFTNSYVVDGIPVSTSAGGLTFVPSPEGVSESKVQSNAYDAEVGRTGGGVFATSLKSGSAVYHGVLYGETRQTPWAGNQWFNFANSAGVVAPTPDNTTYLYSGAFGGPLLPNWIKKPHWLDNTFFWVTEEGYRQGQPNVSNTTAYFLPTAAERLGDFSAYAPANGSKTSCAGTTGIGGGACEILYDPTQPFTGGARTVTFLTEYGANKIPSNMINAIGQYVANAFPAPQTSTVYGAGAYNYSNASISFKTRSDEYIGKLEHTFAPWWTAAASYVHNAIQEPAPNVIQAQYANATKLLRYTDSTAVNNTFTINPTTLLTAAFGFNRYYSAAFQYSSGFDAAKGFGGTGFSSAYASLLQSPTFPGFSFSNFTNSGSLGASNGGPTINASNNVAIVLSKTINKHNVKLGYTLRALAVYTNPTGGGAGAFVFSGQNSNATGGSSSTNGTLAVADLLMGLPSSGSLTLNTGVFINQAKYNAVFVQDDFRLNQKLTMNIGLRYEYELGQSERSNRFNVGFDPKATAQYVNAAGATVTTKGGLDFAGANGAPIHCCSNSHTKFSPRIGVAYQPFKNTVFHAGYGVFFAPVAIATGATAGFSQTSSYTPGSTTASTVAGPGAYLSNPFATGVLLPTGNTLAALTGIGSALGSTAIASAPQEFGRRYPFMQQYSVDVQQHLPYDVVLKISYIGAHGRNFLNATNINQLPDSVLSTYAGGTANLTTKVTNPYYATKVGGLPSTGVLASSTVAQGQLLLPFPQFSSVTVARSSGYTNYNSLAIKAEKHTRQGLTLLTTYTWASNWDNLWSTGSQIYNNYGPQDANNPKGEYARSLNSIPNRFTAAISYELPFGRGRKFLSGPSGFVGNLIDYAVGGWQINDEWIIQNGVPISINQTNLSASSTFGTTGVGGVQQRPNLAGDIHSACGSGRPQGRLGAYSTGRSETAYINASAFTAAPAYTYGNTPRTLPCRVPGTNSSSISVNKTIKIRERFNLQIRAEALNAFNTPQFGTPTSSLTASQTNLTTAPVVNPASFGNITTTVGFARIIQLGGRLSF